jgi:hypothetical protein
MYGTRTRSVDFQIESCGDSLNCVRGTVVTVNQLRFLPSLSTCKIYWTGLYHKMWVQGTQCWKWLKTANLASFWVRVRTILVGSPTLATGQRRNMSQRDSNRWTQRAHAGSTGCRLKDNDNIRLWWTIYSGYPYATLIAERLITVRRIQLKNNDKRQHTENWKVSKPQSEATKNSRGCKQYTCAIVVQGTRLSSSGLQATQLHRWWLTRLLNQNVPR